MMKEDLTYKNVETAVRNIESALNFESDAELLFGKDVVSKWTYNQWKNYAAIVFRAFAKPETELSSYKTSNFEKQILLERMKERLDELKVELA